MPTAAATASVVAIQKIPLNKIVPSPFQTRKDFNKEELQGLAQSMKQHDLLNPIIVRKVGGKFELIAGERRVRAAQLLGWSVIDARIQDVDDMEAAQQVVVENLQRDDLNPIEMAEGYKKLAEMGMTQTKIALEVGVSQATVAKYLALLDLPAEIQEIIPRGIISEGHARYLRQIKDPKRQIELARQVDREGWSVKETERRIKLLSGGGGKTQQPYFSPRVAPSTADPMAAIWAKLQAINMNNAKWSVSYPAHEVWRFEIHPNGGSYAYFLSEWFGRMARAMADLENEQVAIKSNVDGFVAKAPPAVADQAQPAPEEEELSEAEQNKYIQELLARNSRFRKK